MIYEMIVFCGRANKPLGESICSHLRLSPGRIRTENFSDGEIFVQLRDNVRGMDAFVVQPTSPPGNDNIMELLIIVDALKRASAHRITAVVPYFGYARQDRTDRPRVPITAKLTADLLTAAGVNRLLTMDLHAGQIQGFFSIPVDNLMAAPVLISEILKGGIDNPIVVSPDAGGVERANAFARRLNCGLAIVDKRRDKEVKNQAAAMHVIGDVKGKSAIIVDDMIDTAGTMCAAADILLEAGAEKVFAAVTHPVLSGPAYERLEKSSLEKLFITNTIHHEFPPSLKEKIQVVDIAHFLSDAVARIHFEKSVSELYYDYR